MININLQNNGAIYTRAQILRLSAGNCIYTWPPWNGCNTCLAQFRSRVGLGVANLPLEHKELWFGSTPDRFNAMRLCGGHTHTHIMHTQSISGDAVGVKMASTSDASLVQIADKCSNLYPGKPSQVSNLFFLCPVSQ